MGSPNRCSKKELQRIVHIVPQLQPGDGISSVVMNYAHAIDHSRFIFDIVCHRADHAEYVEDIRSMGGTVHVFPKFSTTNYSDLRKKIRVLFSADEEGMQYSAVHCHMSNAAFLYLREAKKAGVPVRILHSHQTKYADTLSHALRNIPLIAIGRRYANMNLACSDQAGRFLFGQHNYIVLPNAVDTNRFAYNRQMREALRKKLGIGNRAFCRLYGNVGRLSLQKNQSFLLKVFQRILRDDTTHDSKLVIIGEGPLRNELRGQAEALGIQESVLWISNVADTSAYYSAMDAFLLPSLHEGLPVSAIEAQCAGLPCLVADNIDRQSLILPQSYHLPIEDADIWAKSAIESARWVSEHDTVRSQAARLVSRSGFDIRKQVSILERIYLQTEKDNARDVVQM